MGKERPRRLHRLEGVCVLSQVEPGKLQNAGMQNVTGQVNKAPADLAHCEVMLKRRRILHVSKKLRRSEVSPEPHRSAGHEGAE